MPYDDSFMGDSRVGLLEPLSLLDSTLLELASKISSRTSRPWWELQRLHYKSDGGVRNIDDLARALEHFHCTRFPRHRLECLWQNFFNGDQFDFKALSDALFPLDREAEGKLIIGGRMEEEFEDDEGKAYEVRFPMGYDHPTQMYQGAPPRAPTPVPVRYPPKRPDVYRASCAPPSQYFLNLTMKQEARAQAEKQARSQRLPTLAKGPGRRGGVVPPTAGRRRMGQTSSRMASTGTGSRGRSRSHPHQLGYVTNPKFYAKAF
jgi:hypothetical protein